MVESPHYGIIYFLDFLCPIKYKVLNVSTLKHALKKFKKFVEKFGGTPEYYNFFVAQIDFGQHGPTFLLTDKIDEFKIDYEKIDKKKYPNSDDLLFRKYEKMMNDDRKYEKMMNDDDDDDNDDDDEDVFGDDHYSDVDAVDAVDAVSASANVDDNNDDNCD